MPEPFDPYAAPNQPRPIAYHRAGGGWIFVYSVAMLSGAFVLCSCLAIRYEGFGGPAAGGLPLLLFAVYSIIGAAVGFVLVAIVHLLSRLKRHRKPGNIGKFGRDLGDGF